MEIFSRNNGCFLFKFESEVDVSRILEGGPWLFEGRLMILKHWNRHVGLERDVLSSIPVWIRFPNLQIQFWMQTIINKLASTPGTPICSDIPTASHGRTSLATCLVEIYAKRRLASKVEVMLENGIILSEEVIYEWIPPRCVKCVSFGHGEE